MIFCWNLLRLGKCRRLLRYQLVETCNASVEESTTTNCRKPPDLQLTFDLMLAASLFAVVLRWQLTWFERLERLTLTWSIKSLMVNLHSIRFCPFFLRFCFSVKKYALLHPHFYMSVSALTRQSNTEQKLSEKNFCRGVQLYFEISLLSFIHKIFIYI